MKVIKNQMKIKKGYSLIELLVVLSIILLFIGYCGFKCNKFKEVYSNNIEVDFCNNYILHMLQ
ncbi:prepilin-type N-terminal cleavage/methylation domain-containing protein, partial [Clostridium botulinum C/D]|nr:prepilin-type N-terminal cleavage/methylation domain-containing protein [Clostridium botulinum C/D]